jgi:hypothetical protein
MKLYYFESQENQASLHDSADEYDRCCPNPPRSLMSRWSPPLFELVLSDEYGNKLPKSDFPTVIGGTSVVSSRAATRLQPILRVCGELLPIRLSNDLDEYFLFNVTAVVNAVDMKQSKFFRLSSGKIGHCLKLVFDSAKIPSDALFFKNTQMGPITEIYATEAAKEAVENAGLTGYEFRLAWSD